MTTIKSGSVFEFSMLVFTCLIGVFFIYWARRKSIPIRRLPALDAVEEMVGRCTEMGRPIMSTAISSFSTATIAALSLASYAAELCAKTKTKIVALVEFPDSIPLTRDLLRSEYVAAGAADMFEPEDQVRYYGHQPTTKYISGIQLSVDELKPGGVLLCGPWGAGPSMALMAAETAARSGAMTIGGTPGMQTCMSLAITCDYILIGEELYAVGAYLSKDPAMYGTIAATDVLRVFFALFMIVGLLLSIAGSNALVDFLKI